MRLPSLVALLFLAVATPLRADASTTVAFGGRLTSTLLTLGGQPIGLNAGDPFTVFVTFREASEDVTETQILLLVNGYSVNYHTCGPCFSALLGEQNAVTLAPIGGAAVATGGIGMWFSPRMSLALNNGWQSGTLSFEVENVHLGTVQSGTVTGSHTVAKPAQSSNYVYSTVNGTLITLSAEAGSTPCANPGINNSSQIVGVYTTSSLGVPCHGFVKDGANISSFDYPGAYVTSARGINDAGQIVGTQCGGVVPLDIPFCAAFLKDGNTFTSFGFPGAFETGASGINNTGQSVGGYTIEIQVGNGVQDVGHGLLIDHGVSSTLDFPGAVNTGLSGINDAAVIVGSYKVNIATWPQFRWSGFVYRLNTWESIDYPGAILTFARAINNLGQVVGDYTDSYGFIHGFIRTPDNKKLSPFDIPGADTVVSGINDLGEIVGLAYPRPVAETIGTLVTRVSRLDVVLSIKTSLIASLDHATAAFNGGEFNTACGDVATFIQAVQTQSGTKIIPVVADDLLAQAARIKAMIGCQGLKADGGIRD